MEDKFKYLWPSQKNLNFHKVDTLPVLLVCHKILNILTYFEGFLSSEIYIFKFLCVITMFEEFISEITSFIF